MITGSIHRFGKDKIGSIKARLAVIAGENLEACRIRLNPLDYELPFWPDDWPPVVADETVPPGHVFIDITPTGPLDLLDSDSVFLPAPIRS